MILRRFMNHVNEQNWFAVGLDVIVVIVGIYLGIQVTEWSNERDRRMSEQQYLERLHQEIQQLVDTRAMYEETRKDMSATLSEVTDIINGKSSADQLTDEHCRIIAHSSFTTIPPEQLPSINDLISSGRLEQIASLELRSRILEYIQDVARVRDLITLISESNESLGLKFPELLHLKFLPEDKAKGRALELKANCDLAELKNDQSFVNHLNTNVYMYVIYTERGVLELSQKLKALHIELDRSLGLSH